MIRWICGAIRPGLLLAALFVNASVLYADPPAGKEIAEVIVQGHRLRTVNDIRSQLMRTREGTIYTDEGAQEDMRRLHSKGWFTPRGVELLTQERPDGRITVFVRVAELSSFIQEVEYKGNDHLSRSELDTLTGLRRGMPLSPVAVQTARQAILRKYQEAGRIHANVVVGPGDKLGDERVVFNITEGPIVKVKHVNFNFVGKRTADISEGRLRQQIQTSRSRLGIINGEYDAGRIDSDVVKLTEYYHGLGYLDTRVSRELIPSEDHRSIDVVFHIEEGPRYKVGKLQISGNKVFNEQDIAGYTDLREGDYYSKDVVQADLKRVRDVYGHTGRPIAIYEERPVPSEGKTGIINVNYVIQERDQVRVADVKIVGNRVTRDNVIRRQIPLYPGQILSYPDLLIAQENLSRLGIFEDDPMQGVRPTVEVENPQVDEPYKNILVTVQEKPTGSFMIGAGVNSDAGVTGSVVLNERNFDILRFPTSLEDVVNGRAWRGGGQEFRLEAVPGSVFQRYTMSWREPSFLDSLYSLGLSAYYYSRGFGEYNERRVGGRLTVGRRLNQLWTANFTTRVEGVTVFDVPYNAPDEIKRDAGYSFLVGVTGGVRRDSRDSYLRPTKGSVLDLSVEQVLGDYQYQLATAEYSKYWTTHQRLDGSGRHVLAFRTQASWAGSEAPVYERFYAGGFRSIRGFQFRGVGPMENGFNVGGDFSFMNSLEYQIPIMANDNLYFVGFVDSGTVERKAGIHDYRVTAGLGMRISMPQVFGPVPLALDFGFPIREAPGDKRQLFSFWIGVFN